jgi:hypothetical protein
MTMPKRKAIPGQRIRNTWRIKPVTRIHDHDIRKNKKAWRQQLHKELKQMELNCKEVLTMKSGGDINQ